MRNLWVGVLVVVAVLGPRPAAAQSVRELGGPTAPVTTLAFSPNGELLATAGDDDVVRIWRLDGTLQWVSPKLFGAATALAFRPDGLALAVGNCLGRVEVWGLTTGNEPAIGLRFTTHLDGVSALAYTANGLALCSCGPDKMVKVWDMTYGTAKHSIGPLANSSAALAVSPDGECLAVADGQSVAVYDTREFKFQRALPCPDGAVSSLAFSPDSRTLAAACGEGTIRLWSLPGFQAAERLQGHSAPVRQLSFDARGRRLCSVGANGQTVIWDTATGSALFSHRFPAPTYCGAISPDGERIAVATWRPRWYLLDLPRNVR